MLTTLISSGVIFALLSLVAAGFLDVLYKRYSSIARSRGMFLMGMGLMFGLLQLLAAFVGDQPLQFDSYTLAYGLAAGVLVTASNIMLIESFTHLEVSLGSTIYRLNTLGVVMFSTVFLAEALPLLKVSGILFGIFAALLLYKHHTLQTKAQGFLVFFWVAVLAAAFRAGFGVVSKAGLSAGGDGSTIMILAAFCWIVGGFAYAWLRESDVSVNITLMKYVLVTGAVVFLVVNTLFAALARGDASVVIPIANLSFVVALMISMVLGMEHLNLRKTVAMVFAGIAIVLLARV